MKYWLIALVIIILLSLLPQPSQAQQITCADEYAVQAGDWLSKVAQKYYDNVHAYTVIVNATNLQSLQDDRFQVISNPAIIEPGQLLCVPSADDAEAMLNGEILPSNPQAVNPPDKMLIILGNRTMLNIPTTFTISGGEFGEEGGRFLLDVGQEERMELEAGEYRILWSAPGQNSFGRRFIARPGMVVISWFVPEDGQIFSEIMSGQETLSQMAAESSGLGQLYLPTVQHEEHPFEAPEGRALLAASNRSQADLPSTLTISGGQFAGGREFNLNPAQTVIIALEPERYRLTWSAPRANSLSREIVAVPGEVTIMWIVPEDSRAFVQAPGQPGQEMK